MKKLFKPCAVATILCTSLVYSQLANASVAWDGQATYPTLPLATTTGNFDTYAFGAGIALIDLHAGGTFDGYFQTYVSRHELAGVGVDVPGLRATGNGSGFELTVGASFSGTSSVSANNNIDFTITSGTASLYFDDSPNYSFGGDAGFVDGTALLTGNVASGTGTIIQPASVGIGVSAIDLGFSGLMEFIASGVFDPNTVNGGSILFSLKADTPLNSNSISVIDSVKNGTNTVMGHSARPNNAFLVQTTGNLSLSAVPVPVAFWLFGSAAMGLIVIGRNRNGR